MEPPQPCWLAGVIPPNEDELHPPIGRAAGPASAVSVRAGLAGAHNGMIQPCCRHETAAGDRVTDFEAAARLCDFVVHFNDMYS